MAGGQRNAGIPHLDHQIHFGEVLGEGLLGLGDMTWIPLNRWSGAAQGPSHLHPGQVLLPGHQRRDMIAFHVGRGERQILRGGTRRRALRIPHLRVHHQGTTSTGQGAS